MATLGDLQRDPSAPAPATTPGLPLRVERTRTFDTPEFAGMTFLEVETKSALNRVRGMPFGWSINPYRGCSHACSYCLGGDTPILMADGRTTPLAELRRGDAVYGTVSRGADRRYTVTEVSDHWSTVKPAYRVRLEDGTALVTSGDHRFLTDCGWKHVTDAEHGRERRPHLTLDNTLVGTGAFAPPPKKTADYRQGYLCGMIRGDGHEGEALERCRRYLTDCRAAGPATVRRLVEWPLDPSADWAQGFLAGIVDAEAGGSPGVLRITNTDERIIDQATRALRRFGLAFALERAANGCRTVRLLGGLRERLRFFHTTDPAVTRRRTIDGLAVKRDAPLRVVAVEPLGLDLELYDITTGTGDFIANGVVSHNCFARPTHRYLNLSPLGDFERTVVVKTNVGEVLTRELAKPSWRGDSVAMGTNTDPYQRCEGRYRLMPGIIKALGDARTPFSILTKGTLVTRDLGALQAAAEQVPVTAAFTVGMLDEDLWRSCEPGTPSPAARLAAVRRLNDAGIRTGVMLAPIMPGLNDDRAQLAALVDAAAAAGATHITPIVLHLRPGVRELFWPWLSEHHPELVARYARLYTKSTAAKDYREPVEAFVAEQRAAAWARHGRPPPAPRWRAAVASAPVKSGEAGAEGEQLRLL